jgi:hypothetical protein
MKILSAVAVLAGALVILSSAADARGGRGKGHGASGFAPGHAFRSHGPVYGYRGASGYAPGHMKRIYGPGHGPGASGYAPGHRFR